MPISKAKQTKRFLKSGQLDNQIQKRRQLKQFKNKVKGRQVKRVHGVPAHQQHNDDDDDEDDLVTKPTKKANHDGSSDSDEDLNVDQVLGAQDMSDEDDDQQQQDDNSDFEDDNLSDLGSETIDSAQHVADLKALAENDPEFFKYLQENDAELLDFAEQGDGEDDADDQDDDDDEDEEMDSDDDSTSDVQDKKGKGKATVKPARELTKEILKRWQKSMLETRSIRALRQVLLAFRAAASPEANSLEGGAALWRISNPAVYHKLIVTTLKYTPVVVNHHAPAKPIGGPSAGKYKVATNSKQFAIVQRLLKSYFVSLNALLDTASKESGIPAMAVTESSKLVPWIVGNRKVARAWVKMLLGLYESASDEVRVAAFLALRKLAVASDHSLRESVLKGTYATLLASSKATSIYTLPSLTLMKNSAAELFLLPGKAEGEMAYQLTFGYVRMLAILLRKGLKEGSKDAFKAVYNWQFVHAVDFWSLVLSASGDKDRVAQYGESPLQQLLYPLIQVALGAIRLVPTSRYYPLRFHLVRSLLRIVQRTGTYIPLAAPLFEVLDSPDLTKRTKPTTLKPLDLEYFLKCPTAYQKTRVYGDALADETVYLLVEYFATLSKSIAFPELSLPAVVNLKRHAKKTGQAKLGSMIKILVDKLEANAKWIEARRDTIEFGPGKRDKVERFLSDDGSSDPSPLAGYLRVQRKVRDQKRATLERAAQGDDDI